MTENNLPECRICFDVETDDDPFISPCSCKGTSLYVHKSCLYNWRNFNIDLPAWNKCMECNTQYLIYRKYPVETLIFNVKPSQLYFYENIFALVMSFFIWFLEFNTDYIVIRTLNFNLKLKEPSILSLINSKDLAPQVFYFDYSIFIISLLFHSYILFKCTFNIKNKTIFIQNFGRPFLLCLLFNLQFVIYYYLFVFNSLPVLFLNIITPITFLIPYSHYKLIKYHDRIVNNINIANEGEVLSFYHNPLITNIFTSIEIN